jgi:hypothetical protein
MVVSLVVAPPGVTVVLGPVVVAFAWVLPPCFWVVPPPLLLLLPPPPQLAKRTTHRTKAIATASSFFVSTNGVLLKDILLFLVDTVAVSGHRYSQRHFRQFEAEE